MTTLPAGWRFLTPLALAGEDKSRLVIGPFGSNLKTSDYRDEGVPLVFVRDIRANSFQAPRAFVSLAKAQELRSHIAQPGDVLVTKMGDPPGDACVYTGGGDAIITADCIRLRPVDDFDAKYIAYALQAPSVRRQVESITRGVAQRKVNLGRFRTGIVIPVPPLETQRRIIEVLEDHMQLIDRLEEAIKGAERRALALRSSLLGAALTGRLASAAADLPPAPEKSPL